MKTFSAILVVVGTLTFARAEAPHPALVPLPAHVEWRAGSFTADSHAAIAAGGFADAAQFLSTALKLPVREGAQAIRFAQVQGLPVQGYELEVAATGVAIRASAPAGAFYAVQTLLQLQTQPGGAFAAVAIRDEPRFPWRGLMLDSCRHFIQPQNVKRMIDLAAMLKLNILHLHLTDDQGWRIEIKKYPKLTEIGSVRAESTLPGEDTDNGKCDGKPYGGFYTEEQIRDIVAYAKARYTTVIPEIEMPGHAAAAIAAYPELGNQDVPGYHPMVQPHGGVFPYTFSPSEKTFQFIDDVIGEVCALFPDAPYIHIGGDEAPKTQWNQSAFARNFMKQNHLKNANELQSYFVRRVEKMVNARGRKLLGWDEIQEGGLSPTATMMVWRNTKWALMATEHGNDVVITPSDTTYICVPEGPAPNEPGFKNWGYSIPLKRVYDFDPLLPTLKPGQRQHVLGTEANLWSEYIYNQAKLEYVAFPRLCALAEVAWTPPENKNLQDFLARWELYQARLDALHVNYRKSDGSPALPEWKIVNQ